MSFQPPSPPLTNVPNTEDEKPYENVPTPVNTGKYPPFGALASLYEKLSKESKHDLRRKLLANWFRRWREDVGPDLYPVLRLLLPQKDRERAVYNIKEKTLAKIYIRIIPLNMKDEDAIRLLNWKKPSEKDKTAGDFPMVLFEVISKRSNVMEGTLSIQRLNNLLDALSKSGGKLDQQTTIMTTIYNNCTPAEQRWIVRIILKDLIISVKETTVFSVFHEDAMALFNTCSDLKRVAYELCDPKKRLADNEKTVTLGQAFAPMLCKRPTKRIEDTVKLMGGIEFFIEEKLDGERMQLHKKGNEYFYCSRKGKDYTYLYGKTVGEGSLTPYICQAFDARVDSIILDGEMLVWDPVTERHLPFGTLKTAALDKSKKELRPRPCFKIFDILYFNGRSLIDVNLAQRKERMRRYVSQVQGRLEYVQEFIGKTAKDVRKRMDEILENKGEGLILKRPDAKYTLNGRNIDFIKVKPEYMDDMGETVDVLVVAGDWGSGKRGGGVSTLICAVRDDRHPENDDGEPKYSTFVRIGSGFTFADFAWIRAKPWKLWVRDDPPAFLQTARKGIEDKGDLYLEPEDSFIIKVKAAEIVPSDQYHLNLTMRFPRALAIRDDLSIEDCLTATALFEELQSAKKRKASDSREPQKKRKGNTKKPMLLPQFQGANVAGLDVKSSLLKGMKFQVTPDPKSPTAKRDKNELETLIYLHGGDYSQLPRKDTSMVVYDGVSTPPSILSIINKGQLDIIRSAWIKESIANEALLPCSKRYFFHATETRKLDDDYDLDVDDVDDLMDDVTRDTSDQSFSRVEDDFANTGGIQSPGSPEDQESEQDADVAHNRPEDETVDYDSDPNDDDYELLDQNEEIMDLDDSRGLVKKTVQNTEEVMDRSQNSDTTISEESPIDSEQNELFRNLYFYLDTAFNASQNGMPVDKDRKFAVEIAEKFQEIEEQLTTHGGNIVGLDDPKLTHVLYDKRDESRRIQLLRKTSKSKRRHVLMTDWVTSSIAEGGLLDEAHFS